MNDGRIVSLPLPNQRLQLFHFMAAFFMLCFLLMQAAINAQPSWDQFRGSHRNGIIRDVSLPDKLPAEGPERLWTIDVGNGFSEVATSGDVVYIMSSDTLEGGYEYVAAFGMESGKERWKTKVDSMWFEKDGWGHGPRSTPAIDDENLYGLSGYGKFFALDKSNGNLLWAVNLPEQFGTTIPRWGFSTSPLLVDDVVILETGGTDSRAFTAFNKKTGEPLWSKGAGSASYCSPLAVDINGETHVVFANDTMLYAYSPAGDERWTYRMPLRAPMSMPVFIPPNGFFESSVSRTGSFVVEVNGKAAEQKLASKTMQNEWSNSCYLNGYLYGFSRAKLQCVSAETGEMTWGKRGYGKGSLIVLGDKLLVLSDLGKLIMVKADPETYTELGSFQALEGKCWTAPSFANGKLFVRNLSKMSCYKLSN